MPPAISKQKPLQQKTTPPIKTGKGGILDRIRPVTQVDSGGLKISLYGRAKTGKTRLIGTFPKPCLILGGEDGTRSIRTVPDVYFIKIVLKKPNDGTDNYCLLDELPGLIDSLKESEYASVAMDTAVALYDLYMCDIMDLSELPAQKSWGMATRDQYGTAGLKTKETLRRLLNLHQHVVITAHERNFNEEGGSELIAPTIGPSLSPSVAGWLNGAVEYICQTFIREEVKEVATAVKGQTIMQATGKKEYCLRTGPHSVYMTGFRLPPGITLPESIVDPSFDKINRLVQGLKAELKPTVK